LRKTTEDRPWKHLSAKQIEQSLEFGNQPLPRRNRPRRHDMPMLENRANAAFNSPSSGLSRLSCLGSCQFVDDYGTDLPAAYVIKIERL
jgi:hypothetical protein